MNSTQIRIWNHLLMGLSKTCKTHLHTRRSTFDCKYLFNLLLQYYCWSTFHCKHLFNLLLQYTSLSGPSQAILEIMCEAFIGSYCRNSNSEFLCWLGGKFHALCIKFRVTSSVMLSSRNNLIKKFFIILLWLGSVKCEKLDVTTLGKTSYKKECFLSSIAQITSLKLWNLWVKVTLWK